MAWIDSVPGCQVLDRQGDHPLPNLEWGYMYSTQQPQASKVVDDIQSAARELGLLIDLSYYQPR